MDHDLSIFRDCNLNGVQVGKNVLEYKNGISDFVSSIRRQYSFNDSLVGTEDQLLDRMGSYRTINRIYQGRQKSRIPLMSATRIIIILLVAFSPIWKPAIVVAALVYLIWERKGSDLVSYWFLNNHTNQHNDKW